MLIIMNARRMTSSGLTGLDTRLVHVSVGRILSQYHKC
jgi:hypothetical protein